eukprot:CAMPEP_0181232462 /NCGR_PEP_ID=MMETSP1096-20121128/35745_1 /TAXON_ID=156174 ORGANISM="Chrysochromulina ericina, Strain CCMP281" /NCGR_SAMPLE_ID=MMETSP1096 /ASSEMBLY_ACC=CAM_ASM_000453 /LENGTH=267 /DNA_ID=CAMNT_0023326757 /DNA_START=287 /DNA_END=1090 /DNA_ORIENTATION=+
MPQVGDHDQASYTERFRSLARLVFEPSGLEVLAEQTTGEELPGESMQSAVWQAGCVLANVMQQFAPGFWHGKRVLELGAGCGVAGLLAAKMGAEMVYLTDLLPLVPLLARNAALNDVVDRVVTCELEWGAEEVPDELRSTPVDIILGSDITPFVQTLPHLRHSILQCSAEHTVVLLSHRDRGDVKHLLEAFEEGFECEEVSLSGAVAAGATKLFRLRRHAASAAPTAEEEEAKLLAAHVDAAVSRGDFRAMKQFLLARSGGEPHNPG